MKNLVLSAAACVLLFTSCQDTPKADKAESSDPKQLDQRTETGVIYTIDTNQSTVEWIGTKPVGQHHGTFKITQGTLTVADSSVVNGRFVVDIKSLKADDQDEEGNTMLGDHLLGSDFFDAQRYPEGTFDITRVEAMARDSAQNGENTIMKNATHRVTGNLELKGVAKSITFPAVISITENQINADASFNINRTEWNMTYGNDKSLGDKFIRPEVNMKIHLVATRQ